MVVSIGKVVNHLNNMPACGAVSKNGGRPPVCCWQLVVSRHPSCNTVDTRTLSSQRGARGDIVSRLLHHAVVDHGLRSEGKLGDHIREHILATNVGAAVLCNRFGYGRLFCVTTVADGLNLVDLRKKARAQHTSIPDQHTYPVAIVLPIDLPQRLRGCNLSMHFLL